MTMNLVCLDLEGVLIPEIWMAVAKESGIKDLTLTTRDISDYDTLMIQRLNILKRNGIKLADVLAVIDSLNPLDGAIDFIQELRGQSPLVLLSDTFEQLATSLMRKLNWPTLFCNTLEIDDNGFIHSYHLRQTDGKRKAIENFRRMGFRIFAAGDSYNDVSMLQMADQGMFFRAPSSIRAEFPGFSNMTTHKDLMWGIKEFLLAPQREKDGNFLEDKGGVVLP